MQLTVERYVKAICPEFPVTEKDVKETYNKDKFYKVVRSERTLYIPPLNHIKYNMTELDKLSDAIIGFAYRDIEDIDFDWQKIKYQDISPAELLKRLPSNEYVSVDIETCNTKWDGNRVLTVGFCWSDTQVYIVEDIEPEILSQLLTKEDIHYIYQNGKFDTTRMAYCHGIQARVDEDTMLQHYAGINERRGTHGLKEMGSIFLQAPKWDEFLDNWKKQFCRQHKIKLSDFSYDLFDRKLLKQYQAYDCVVTRKLFFLFDKILDDNARKVYKMLIKASNTFKIIELNGIYIDKEYFYELQDDLDTRIVEAENALNNVIKNIWDPSKYMADTLARSYPGDFNHKSPKQLLWVLQKLFGSNIRGTGADVLDEIKKRPDLTEEGKSFIQAISDLRKYNKYMDTYVMGFDQVICKDGRIRTSFNLHGTETGRLSSSEPNVQNIPRDPLIKNLISAPEGRMLIQLDYSQAELRVLAYLTKDPWLTNVYIEGKDLHDSVATQMFGPNFTKEQRVQAKTINFGIAYGRGASSLSETFGMPMYEAAKLIENWFKPMPQVKKWIATQRGAPARGEETVTDFGRKRHFLITYENRNSVENESVNFPIQSIASDLTLNCTIEINEWLKENPNIDAKIICTVHDSIILECIDDSETARKVAEIGTKIMREAPARLLKDCCVPFKADVEIGKSWGALEKWKLN